MTGREVVIEVLVSGDCPHAEQALDLARDVSARLGPDVTVDAVVVDTPERAAAIGFAGSPSFRVDGVDLEGRKGSPGTLSCRIYEAGRGVPPAWLLEAAVCRAQDRRGYLFLCVANSARSQLAEGLARALAPARVAVMSAGSQPTQVRPEALAVLAEIGLDSAGQRSKNVAEIDPATVDTVITLCGEEECPLFLGSAARLHWGLPDPAGAGLDAFRAVRDELRRRLAVLFGGDAFKGS